MSMGLPWLMVEPFGVPALAGFDMAIHLRGSVALCENRAFVFQGLMSSARNYLERILSCCPCRTTSHLPYSLHVRGGERVYRVDGTSGEGRRAPTGRCGTDTFPGLPDLAISPLVPAKR